MIQKKNEPTKIVVVGASGFGREIIWTLNDCNKKSKKYEILGFVDDNLSLHGKLMDQFPVLGGLNWFSTRKAKNVKCVVAIGDCKVRYNVVKKLEKKKVKFATIIHPSVILSKFVEIGEGTIIQAGSIITIDVKLGRHVHINIDSTVGHDSVLNDFVTLCPGVHVNGNTILETGVFVGTGSAMNQNIRIGKWSIIGSGTILIEDVPEYSLYVGVPGKLKKRITRH